MPPRLATLPRSTLAPGLTLAVATTRRARLRGLALLREPPHGTALAFPRCRSIHTFGMRFPIDVLFLDATLAPLRVAVAVPPNRIVGCRRARTVVECAAGDANRVLAGLRGS